MGDSAVNLVRDAVAVALASASLVSGCTSGGKPSDSAPAAPASSAPAPSAPASTAPVGGSVSKADGEQVTAVLLGKAVDTTRLMPGLRPEDAKLPLGSDLTLHVESATVDGNVARVPASVTGPLAGTWTVLLVRATDGTWQVYGSVRA
jgi:hypothetical protein